MLNLYDSFSLIAICAAANQLNSSHVMSNPDMLLKHKLVLFWRFLSFLIQAGVENII